MSEKEKAKPAPYYRQFTVPILFAILSIFGAFLVLVLITPLFSAKISQTSLSSEYIPTAEHLLENPMPNPHNLRLHVEQDTGGFGDEVNVEWFCVHLIVPHGHRSDIVEFQFNRVTIWGTAFRGTMEGLEGDDGYLDKFCIYGQVETGLHIITLRLNEEMFGEIYTHEWAVEITNDGYNYFSIPN
jgi:hypothetical protein